MLKRLFSRPDAAEAVDEEAAAGARHGGGLSLGVLWFLAFLLSAVTIGAVGFLTWRQLEAQTGTLSDAALKAQGDRLGAEINGRLQGLIDVVERAAAQPALAPLLAGGDPAAIAAQADLLTAAIPDALRVRLLPPGATEPDESLSPRLGYAGIDLAQRAIAGKRPPLELHWAGAPDQYIAVARAVTGPDQAPAGVLLACIDPKALDRWLAAALPEGAYVEIRQAADGQATIAARGDAAWKPQPPLGTVPLAGTAWELAYWLPQTPPLSTQTRIAFVIPFGAAVGVLALLFFVLGVVDSRLVRADLTRLVGHIFDRLQRRRDRGQNVRLRDFRRAVEMLDENLHAPARPEAAPAAAPTAAPENPLFIPQGTIQVEEVDGDGKQ